MPEDPLHVPAELRDDNTDYQWFSVNGPRKPEDGGWLPVDKPEMPGFHVEYRELRLFKRPLAVTEYVREQERAVAMEQVTRAADFSKHGGITPRPVVAKIVSSPMGAFVVGWSLRRWLICLALRVVGHPNRASTEWLVCKFCRKTSVGMQHWAEQNHLSFPFYIELHTEAILRGRGRWPGVIVTGRPR